MAREVVILQQNKQLYKKLQKQGVLWARSLTWGDSTKKSLHIIEQFIK